ncbi:MAG: hypothetical protein M3247_08225 [Thermoproteota archaeon]|nr:hypothetical protein [Thermoproteota archaeon]
MMNEGFGASAESDTKYVSRSNYRIVVVNLQPLHLRLARSLLLTAVLDKASAL